jgi:hypothetical protein
VESTWIIALVAALLTLTVGVLGVVLAVLAAVLWRRRRRSAVASAVTMPPTAGVGTQRDGAPTLVNARPGSIATAPRHRPAAFTPPPPPPLFQPIDGVRTPPLPTKMPNGPTALAQSSFFDEEGSTDEQKTELFSREAAQRYAQMLDFETDSVERTEVFGSQPEGEIGQAVLTDDTTGSASVRRPPTPPPGRIVATDKK